MPFFALDADFAAGSNTPREFLERCLAPERSSHRFAWEQAYCRVLRTSSAVLWITSGHASAAATRPYSAAAPSSTRPDQSRYPAR